MKFKTTLSLAAAAVMTVSLAGCGSSINNGDDPSSIVIEDSSSQALTTTTTAATTTTAVITEPVPEIVENKIVGSNIAYVKFSKTVEAESCKLSGTAKQDSQREGYRGEGYVTGITAQGQWQAEFNLTHTQYYNIGFAAASDEKKKNAMTVDGKRLSEFTSTGNGHFELITVKNVYLEKGKHTLTIEVPDPKLDIDYCFVTASEDISKISFSLDKPALSDKSAGENAKALYNYLCASYGKTVLLAQHDSVAASAETDLIYKNTGKYPAIRFGDLVYSTDADNADAARKELEIAEKYASNDGIVAYMWHWSAPMGNKTCYSSDTDFDLSKAVTKENIATLPISEIEKLEKKGKVSKECVAIVKDIDTVSTQLSELCGKGVPVIWRPLHEASNGYFWWGKDAASYKWLWKLLYTRQTQYHKLHDLIWVWSAQNAGWYVGDSMCDIISCDLYGAENPDNTVNSLLFLQGISRKKPAAVTECDTMPSVKGVANEKAYWSFIGQWGGNYIMKNDGTFSSDFNSLENLRLNYNNNITVTRDKLPSLEKMKTDYKAVLEKQKQEQEKQKAKETAAITQSAPAENE